MRSYKIISALSSKQKNVYKIESQGISYILKEYANKEEAEKEMSVAIQVATTGYAPKVIEREGNIVVYEYVDGENFWARNNVRRLRYNGAFGNAAVDFFTNHIFVYVKDNEGHRLQ